MAPSAVWFPYALNEGLQGRCSEWELQKQTVMSIVTPITWWVLLTKDDQKNRKSLHSHAPGVDRRTVTFLVGKCDGCPLELFGVVWFRRDISYLYQRKQNSIQSLEQAEGKVCPALI